MRHTILIYIIAALLPCACFGQADSLLRHRSAGEIAASAGGALLINAGLTEALKHSVHEMRPDRTGNNSFPSRHTSWAFTASTILSNELYRYSPWWSLGAQAASTLVGAQRVATRRHYASDVLAGAALGVASTELSYFICRKIFGSDSPRRYRMPNDFRMSVSMTTGASFVFDRRYRSGLTGTIDFRLPIGEHWGWSVSGFGATTPIKIKDRLERPLNIAGIRTGACGHAGLGDYSMAAEWKAEVGYARNLKVTDYCSAGGAFTATAEGGLSMRLTQSFGCRASVGYSLTTFDGCKHGLTVGVSSIAVF